MMKKIIGLLIFNLLLLNCFATHNRAGEITFRQTGALSFEITITTFTYSLSPADRNELEVQWGDNTSTIAPRVSKIYLPNHYIHNTYITSHIFPGPGIYEILVQDPNRNYGVVNIPGSVNVIFSIKSTLFINPQVGKNDGILLMNPPIDKAAVHHIFIHNPAAYSPDGDSISYKLTTCTAENGTPIANYTFPKASDTLYIDPVKGDLVWNTPVDTGIYNIAFNIETWRNGSKIGNVVRDMQIEVHNVKNQPPLNGPLSDKCVVAGNALDFDITSTDADKDSIQLTVTGGPFAQTTSPATFKITSGKLGAVVGKFHWKTDYSQARKQPYSVVVKSTDNSREMQLVDIDDFNIQVIAPAPKNVQTLPGNNAILVKWAHSPCSNVTGYEIFRKEKTSDYKPDSCQTGLPASSGFTLVGTTKGINDTIFLDTNKSSGGLLQGLQYCYRIVAVLSDGAQSFPSDENCGMLVPGNPALTEASVTKVDDVKGSVFLAWAKPRGLDTIPAPGPYEYRVYRSNDLWGQNFNLIHTFQTADLNDTTYTDTGLNTRQYPYSYKVELYNNAAGNRFLIGTPEIASTFYPDLIPADNQVTISMKKNVPWVNTEYDIYRLNNTTQQYDSVGVTNAEVFVDKNLVNGVKYCYQIKSKGWRPSHNIIFNNLNWSHINCTTPLDTVAPCPPSLEVRTNCDSLYNRLVWTNPNHFCPGSEVVKYNLYFKNSLKGEFAKFDSVTSPDDTVYFHRNPASISGCYAVTAVDSLGNESRMSVIGCVDECMYYDLPNVFTPNNDSHNDLFKAVNRNNYVKKVDMKIYNRWGQLVFHTSNPDIMWDGTVMNSNKVASPGVYYYSCDVYENRLSGEEVRNMVGFVHVYSGSSNTGGE